ncbi:MAG: 3-phosphoshikimate 1-carboxyvinyltransferase [Brumimicrobium sp.]
MNEVVLFPKTNIRGTIKVPPSKSYAQRVIALSALSQDNVVISNIGNSEDVQAAKKIIASLGVQFIEDNDSLIVIRPIENTNQPIEIDCGESGLSTRLFSAFSLLFDQEVIINGSGSLKNRTMDMAIEGLQQFGKNVISNDGKIPLVISGKTSNYSVELDGSISSQFITGVLLVAPFLNKDTEIVVKNPTSKPYLSMTLELLRDFQLEFDQSGFHYFKIEGNQEVARPVDYVVEGDWSSASFLTVSAALGGEVELLGLKKYSKQGDRRIIDALEKFGASIEWNRNDLKVKKNQMIPFEIDATECPDLFPPLAVLAAYANGKSTIIGSDRLLHKESNRATAIQTEFSKIGIKVLIEDNKMHIYGGTINRDKVVEFFSHNDHRMAMALSLFSIGSTAEIIIHDSGAIDKSYPHFYDDFNSL